MRIWRAIKRGVRAAVGPSVLLGLSGYFIWNATQGDHGLKAYEQRLLVLQTAQVDVTRAQSEKAMWERRVAAMRARNLDRDALDERARATLNLSDPQDIIVMYSREKKLF